MNGGQAGGGGPGSRRRGVQGTAALLERLEARHGRGEGRGDGRGENRDGERQRLAPLETRLGYEFRRWELLRVALTHKSWSNERANGWESLGVLEFVGDAVLDLVVAQRLWGTFPQAQEGTLTRLRASLVAEAPLAACARGIGLGSFLWLGKGARAQGLDDHPAVLSDALESVIAAVYCDAQMAGGDPIDAASAVVERLMGSVMDELDEQRGVDPKSRLQWEVQGRGLPTPRYEVRPEGDGFVAEVRVPGTMATDEGTPLARAVGASHKEAEMAAAERALGSLNERLHKR